MAPVYNGKRFFQVAAVSLLGLAVCASGCPRPSTGQDDGGTTADADGASGQDVDRPDGGDRPAGGDDGGGGDGGPDTTSPCLLNAFSPGEGIITAHFSEPVDPTTAGSVGSYSVEGSSGDVITFVSASVDGAYVQLQVAPGTRFVQGTTYDMLVTGVRDLAGNPVATTCNMVEDIKRTLFFDLIWHQHQPLYLDPVKDQLLSPWVRKHATKDYYDMASILAEYPKVHYNVNLTSVLLTQLITYYLERLGPFVDVQTKSVNEAAFLATWAGRTDPWIDLLLMDTPTAETVSERQLGLLHKDAWSCVSTSDALMKRFPEYRELRDKPRTTYTQEDFLNLKAWFEIAWFDPDFLRSAVALPNGWVVDLSDVLEERADGTFWLRQPVTEELCNRLVAEEYKIMANVIPIHQDLLYHPDSGTGQIEVLTTPFYHPILPLLVDSDLARENQPFDVLPDPPYRFGLDAFDQVAKAVKFYTDVFGIPPAGMWPGEGSVAEAVVPMFADNGIEWIATGQGVLGKSTPSGQIHWFPYKIDADSQVGTGGSTDDELAIVFRDDGLSNAIGFRFQGMTGEEATRTFMTDVYAQAPSLGEPDRLLTVIMDGENAWENYVRDHDAKNFLHTLYRTLEDAYDAGEVITVTGSEYIRGNASRNVPAHPITAMTELEPLSAGSWIDGTFAIWIGEPEENVAWGCLLRTRQDLARSGLPRPNPLADPPPDRGSDEYKIYMAWEEMYAAEGSDWFWWFGQDMITPANDDTPFDRGFRAHLAGVYAFMREINPAIEEFICPVIIQESGKTPLGPFTEPPTIDGQFVPNEAEWIAEGGFFNDSDSGAVANPNDHIVRVYYGYDTEAVYLGIEASQDLTARLSTDFVLEAYFNHKHILDVQTGETVSDPSNDTTRNGSALVYKVGGPTRVLAMDFSGSQVALSLQAADGAGSWSDAALGAIEVAGPTGAGKIVEMRIPYADINLAYGDPLEVVLLTAQSGADVDLAPNMGSYVLFEDATNVVKVVFVVDVSGDQVPRDTYGSCCDTQPQPDGQGIVYIAGNLPQLGAEGEEWVPNVISLRDDGEAGDELMGDRNWTLIIDAQRGEAVKYKYTIGLPSDEGRWFGTEEFPVTFRGFDVVGDDPGRKLIKLVVHDIFADKPTGGRDGYPGSMSSFEYFYED
ncbi:MAG: Ig-like domain-containing protein [Deltaproteobacteria bacterium]|nr:Ig-like domain-containing protein [Deltaproteobacteria bacterium]